LSSTFFWGGFKDPAGFFTRLSFANSPISPNSLGHCPCDPPSRCEFFFVLVSAGCVGVSAECDGSFFHRAPPLVVLEGFYLFPTLFRYSSVFFFFFFFYVWFFCPRNPDLLRTKNIFYPPFPSPPCVNGLTWVGSSVNNRTDLCPPFRRLPKFCFWICWLLGK